MNQFKEKMNNYAKLVVEVGINVDKGDLVVISCPIERADFARLLSKNSYEKGAREVVVNWYDDELSLLDYTYSPVEIMEDIPQHIFDKNKYLYEQGGKFISVYAEDPELLKNIDSEKLQRVSLAKSKAMKALMKYTMNDINSWCVVSVPTQAWADLVFKNENDSLTKLWETIFEVTRMNSKNPIDDWQSHLELLRNKADWLNENRFKYLHYKSKNGTNLKIELPKGHVWGAADAKNIKGERFIPNMPTEEVYTLPKKDGVNGIVHSTKPLAYNGNVIDDFWLKFEDGRVVDFHAKKGESSLASIFEQDDNARYLGEVALVPHDSPISNSNILFYNTLYDENASCHLAFGKAYPTTIEGGPDMTEEELKEAGVNDSFIHEDFMIGCEDLSIIGIKENGDEVAVFVNGNWA